MKKTTISIHAPDKNNYPEYCYNVPRRFDFVRVIGDSFSEQPTFEDLVMRGPAPSETPEYDRKMDITLINSSIKRKIQRFIIIINPEKYGPNKNLPRIIFYFKFTLQDAFYVDEMTKRLITEERDNYLNRIIMNGRLDPMIISRLSGYSKRNIEI